MFFGTNSSSLEKERKLYFNIAIPLLDSAASGVELTLPCVEDEHFIDQTILLSHHTWR